jgi:DNA-binding CsgD family transcriptional regulator
MRKEAIGKPSPRGLVGIVAACLANAFIRPRARFRSVAFEAATGEILKLASHGLSAREQEIVRGFLGGKSMKTLAWEYGLAYSTVRNALCSAYKKLGISGSVELAALGAKYNVE